MKSRRPSQQTVRKWADRWAAKLGLAAAPALTTNADVFAILTGFKPTTRYAGLTDGDYIYVKTEGMPAQEIRDTVIHELLHVAHPSWPHWKIYSTAHELVRGRSGNLAQSARSQHDYFVRLGRAIGRRKGRAR